MQTTKDDTNTPEPKRSTEIKYINPEVPGIERPVYKGKRYEAMVPDTLDLQEMARLAVNGLTEPTDPEANYEIYWFAVFNTNPPMLRHDESDIVQVKFMEALPLLRLVCGSKQNPHVEQRWMEVMRQMQAPDGLLYLPKKGRPWCKFGEYGLEPPGDHYFSTWSVGRLLGAMTIYYLLTGDAEWKEAGRRVVDGLNKLAVHEGSKAHFACHEFGTEGRYNPPKDPASTGYNPATYLAWAIQGLANNAKHTGSQTALDLAGRLSRWVIEDSNLFDSNGVFQPGFPTKRTHFHAHTMVLLALLDYGITACDREAIDFVRRGFEYGMTQGECLLGFFAEALHTTNSQTLELCELAEMIALAVKLSSCGAGDYWDMADRWVRNLFAEGQLRRAEWVYWMASKSPPSVIPPYHTTDRAVERNIGAFGGWLSPNDFFPVKGRQVGIMHCCTGNSARAIYYVWENILTYKGGKLRINLLLNRASEWADVDSHIPYSGQVDVKIKQSLDLSIRIPEWVKTEEINCTVNGQSRKVIWSGRYAQVGKVQAKDVITLTFPISERSQVFDVEKRRYKVLLRGNTCVAIDPPGINCPLFQRDHYRENTTRWHNLTRFVSEKTVGW